MPDEVYAVGEGAEEADVEMVAVGLGGEAVGDGAVPAVGGGRLVVRHVGVDK